MAELNTDQLLSPDVFGEIPDAYDQRKWLEGKLRLLKYNATALRGLIDSGEMSEAEVFERFISPVLDAICDGRKMVEGDIYECNGKSNDSFQSQVPIEELRVG